MKKIKTLIRSDAESFKCMFIYKKKDVDNMEKVDGIEKNGNANVTNTELNDIPLNTENRNDEDKNEGETEVVPEKIQIVSWTELYSYADKLDGVLMIIGIIAAIGNGIAQPGSFIIFGELIEEFINHGKNSTIQIEEEMKTFALYYVYVAIGMFITAFLQASLWSIAAIRQTHRIRIKFFQSIMRQDIGWYDVNEAGGLTTRLSDDLKKIQTGIGDKMGMNIQAIVMFFSGFGLGFFYSWKLTLVILSVTPAFVIGGGLAGKVLASLGSNEQTAYAQAGAVAEEVISSIRTVIAFGGQKEEIERYDNELVVAEKAGVKKALTMGASFGFFHIVLFSCYSLSFWYGSKLVAEDELKPGEMLIVFFCVMIGGSQLGTLGPSFEAVTSARGTAFFVYNVCKRVPPIDCMSSEGDVINNLRGDIEMDNVEFCYPSRPEIKVLDKFNLKIKPGSTVALVGESGCGKSTIVKLMQRFYDCTGGKVLLDGFNLTGLNLNWLRSNIGVVNQEPVLFDMSITENIKLGAISSVTKDEIEKAAKNANAHDFITALPKGYDTIVGECGAQLSGGQKQRVAIARALVRDPKILLFDEATSALDTESEGIVQAALEKASKGRTTIIIAHRLSTVRNADLIVAVKDGKVAECGNHDELMKKNGVYHSLVMMQIMGNGDIKEIAETEMDEFSKLKLHRSISAMSNGTDVRNGTEYFSHQLSSVSVKSEKSDNKAKWDKDKEEEEKIEPAGILRIMKTAAPELSYFLVGGFFSAIIGAFPVVFAIILSEFLGTFVTSEAEKLKSEARDWALGFLALGLANCIGLFTSSYLFGLAGEILTRRLRKMVFTSILRQDVTYFDDPANSAGKLTARLATDASNVQGATSARLNTMIQVNVMLLTVVVLGFYYSWKLTLLIIAFVPFLLLSGAANTKMYMNFAAKSDKTMLNASALAIQAIMNIRTVASIGKETFFAEQYIELIQRPYKKSLKKALVFGLTFGLSGSLMMLANAACFSLGGKMVQEGDLKFEDLFKVVLAAVFGGMIAGQIASFAPDYLAAKISAARIFKIVDTTPRIDSFDENGAKPKIVVGNISFDSVSFNYPTRPDASVLDRLSLEISSGQKIALVGASGCGKSTCISLLERFYDPLAGTVKFDNQDIKKLNVQWLRSQLGLVSQEPVLFARSIKENIVYGLEQDVSDEEVTKAAKNANIHSFITGLPKGYDTLVGEKGTLISGGQKQRIAIARALIRNPKIMLLDEATSALDSESEKMVQAALDVAMEGRTSIVIAHRLSTVQNADLIIVIQGGKSVEMGTHLELLTKEKVYYNLNKAQF